MLRLSKKDFIDKVSELGCEVIDVDLHFYSNRSYYLCRIDLKNNKVVEETSIVAQKAKMVFRSPLVLEPDLEVCGSKLKAKGALETIFLALKFLIGK